MITIKEIEEAKSKMRGIVHYTHLDHSSTFSRLSNNEIYLKLENLQKTGSFKVRGSYNKMISLSKEELERGVIAASAGNHAQGVAYSSSQLNVPCTIVMPKGAPLSKIEATRRYGANVELQGTTFDEALEYAIGLQKEIGATFVHPFDDDAVIAGQGTVGIEIFEQLPSIDAVVCPVGGGGLIAGIALALKTLKPSIKVYGVESNACPSMKASLQAEKPVIFEALPSMADGIAVKKPGHLTFELIQKYVDAIYTVEEMEIARTMLLLLERNKLLAEGSGAVSLAALLYHKIPIEGKNVVPIITGGNVDMNFISRIIEHGMVESGRYLSLITTIPDKPGNLQKLLQLIADLDGNVLNINHQRIGARVFPGQTQIQLSLETKNHAHIDQITQKIKDEGYSVEVVL
ncbi:threonine ammonia-lyase [Litchfieldia salsa]|uniref:threonine ammonia-lyase n=1 Tax=Litchfieldia salsa TaxID=930152 RepID=A0A1H0WL49_9BACI|nr:threonine ammonia-lyase [Litchfieldia salsa]SDP91285.1 threonine dehydratase [Litchfieldia salsa]